MSQNDLTKKQYEFLEFLVNAIKEENLNEDFQITSNLQGYTISSPYKEQVYKFKVQESPKPILDILTTKEIIICTKKTKIQSKYLITQKAYDALEK